VRRWCAFNAVGVFGFVVQLAALGALLHAGVPVVFATAAAVETAVVHNYGGHARWTWADRAAGGSRAARLLRFHVLNGAVSLIGNVVLTWALVRFVHVPPLAANGIAVLACSVVNFAATDRLVFGDRSSRA
jgi:putative flippase GtrA